LSKLSRFIRCLRTKAPGFTGLATPWATLLVTCAGVAWGLVQFNETVKIQRANTALANFGQYLTLFPDGIFDVEMAVPQLNALRCRHFRQAVESGALPELGPPLECGALSQDDIPWLDRYAEAAPADIKDAINREAAMLLLAEPATVRRAMSSFLAVKVCVDARQCDHEIARELFAPEITAFLNGTCSFARISGDDGFERFAIELARFTASLAGDEPIHWSTDPVQGNLFLCETLRPFGVLQRGQPGEPRRLEPRD
jgi:hypothetical protein